MTLVIIGWNQNLISKNYCVIVFYFDPPVAAPEIIMALIYTTINVASWIDSELIHVSIGELVFILYKFWNLQNRYLPILNYLLLPSSLGDYHQGDLVRYKIQLTFLRNRRGLASYPPAVPPARVSSSFDTIITSAYCHPPTETPLIGVISFSPKRLKLENSFYRSNFYLFIYFILSFISSIYFIFIFPHVISTVQFLFFSSSYKIFFEHNLSVKQISSLLLLFTLFDLIFVFNFNSSYSCCDWWFLFFI